MNLATEKLIQGEFACKFSPDGQWLATVGRVVWLWSLPGPTKRWKAQPLTNVSELAFSDDSAQLAVKNTSGRVVILEVKSGKILNEFKNEDFGEGGAMAFANDGMLVDSCWGSDSNWSGSHLVRGANGSIVFQEEFPDEMCKGVHRTSDNRFLFLHFCRVDDPGQQLRLITRTYPFVKSEYKSIFLPFGGDAKCIFSPTGEMIAITQYKMPHVMLVPMYDFASRQLLPIPESFHQNARAFFSSCGKRIAVVDKDLVILDCETHQVIRSLRLGSVHSIDFSPCGDWITVSGAKGTLVSPWRDLPQESLV